MVLDSDKSRTCRKQTSRKCNFTLINGRSDFTMDENVEESEVKAKINRRSKMNRSKSSERSRRPNSLGSRSEASSQNSRSKSCSRSSSNYGRNSPLFPTKSVTSDELDSIVQRVTKPTVASRGGVDLRNKEFNYITPKPQKTRIVIPGLERRYMGIQRVSNKEMDDIITRMTKLTKAYESKYGPDKNVWFDQSPQAKFIRSRSAKV